jgi:hypothetical protein
LQPQQQQQQQPAVEQLSVLSGLQHLTSLKLSGAAPPAAAVRQLAALTRLQRLCVEVTCTQPGAAPASLPDLPGWHPAGALADEHADSSSSISSGSDDGEGEDRSSSGAVLGASLASLTELRTVCLTGVLHAADTLKALSGLPQLVRVELDDLPDFAVASLVNLSGLAHLTALRLHGCRALQATARSALPLQLHSLQELAVLDLDFDLHLRDLQVGVVCSSVLKLCRRVCLCLCEPLHARSVGCRIPLAVQNTAASACSSAWPEHRQTCCLWLLPAQHPACRCCACSRAFPT